MVFYARSYSLGTPVPFSKSRADLFSFTNHQKNLRICTNASHRCPAARYLDSHDNSGNVGADVRRLTSKGPEDRSQPANERPRSAAFGG